MAVPPVSCFYIRAKKWFFDSEPTLMSSAVHDEESSTSLATFTKFPDLPAEMRLKILKLVAHQPRILGVKLCKKHVADRDPEFKFVCHAPVPAILHVNRETREECLKYYKPSFGLKLEPRIYFNNVSDTILLTPSMSFKLRYKNDSLNLEGGIIAKATKEEFKEILHLGLQIVDGPAGFEKDDIVFKRLLSNFPNLASILCLDATMRGCLRGLGFDRLLPLEEQDIVRRYQKRALTKAVQRCYGFEEEHPTVELMVIKAYEKSTAEARQLDRKEVNDSSRCSRQWFSKFGLDLMYAMRNVWRSFMRCKMWNILQWFSTSELRLANS